MEDLRVNNGLTIPGGELSVRFDTSGGPGGQHANRSATRVELSFDLAASDAVDEETRAAMLERLGSRAPGGVISVVESSSRSQWRNRQIARKRLAGILADAVKPVSRRRATRPSAGVRRRRLEDKRRRGEVKRLRRPPGAD